MHQIESFFNWMALTAPKSQRSMMASSYDRRGGNHDWSNYIRREGDAAVMMEAEGPGCLTRIWTADPQKGVVRIWLDYAERPAIEMPFADLFSLLPLSFGIGGESPETYARSRAERVPMGRTSYCPIYFRSHCKITIDPEDDYLYYQINYDLYPPGEDLQTFDLSSGLNTREIERTVEVWKGWWENEPFEWGGSLTTRINIAAGDSAELFAHKGCGNIIALRIALPALFDARAAAHLRENLWLTAHFDDDEPRDPSVCAPIGPLFLDFGQRPAPRSLVIGTDASNAYYSLFSMPYHESASLRILNRSMLDVEGIRVDVIDAGGSPAPDLMRFRATWHVETPFGPDHRDYGGVACRLLNLDGRDNYEILNVRAAGTFVGCGFHADMRDSPTDRACCEGDEMFFIDDDPRLTHYGTGAEDYLNDAWGLRGYGGPISGDVLAGEWGVDPQLYGFRLHLSDAIAFARKGRFTLEHGTGNNCSGHYRSIAYWYMSPASARTRVEERRWEEIRNRTG